MSGEEDLSGCSVENVMDWIGEETTVERRAQLCFSSSPSERGRTWAGVVAMGMRYLGEVIYRPW